MYMFEDTNTIVIKCMHAEHSSMQATIGQDLLYQAYNHTVKCKYSVQAEIQI